MCGGPLGYGIGTIICVAVLTPIFAGIIHADINACNTTALFSLIPILVKIKSAPQKSLKQ